MTRKLVSRITMSLLSAAFVGSLSAEEVNWQTPDKLSELFAQHDKPVYVFFELPFGPSQMAHSRFFNKPEVANYLNENFHAVRFNVIQKEPIEFRGETFRFDPDSREETSGSVERSYEIMGHTVKWTETWSGVSPAYHELALHFLRGSEVYGWPAQMFFVDFSGVSEEHMKKLNFGEDESFSVFAPFGRSGGIELEFERLKFWAEGKYKNQTWTDYKKSLEN